MELLDEWFANDPEAQNLARQESLIISVTEEIWAEMNRQNMSKTTLAEKLGVTKPRVSSMLNGGANLTIRKLADIAHALDKRFVVSLTDVEQKQALTAEPKISVGSAMHDFITTPSTGALGLMGNRVAFRVCNSDFAVEHGEENAAEPIAA
ncbi:helix-turn-helix domain-containing protein [Chromobacterium haemolyticum]|uniref:helix-turn-helix domain-containing protein n=1 Tax=Chromobacterium haemolyticum TaxID=394935 RepID=UPI0017461B2D|nr:helix-turn-helix transcriptional regulator [Chromobacterium haemolyticum]QOD81640.1 helix-turn-helix transcriptional regulator [Chromobacterium haemolyticum]